MSSIVFVNAYFYKLDRKQWNNKTPYPPLGTLYAASLMRNLGYKVHLFDTNLKDDPVAIDSFLKNPKSRYFVIYDDGFNYLTKMCLSIMRDAAFQMIRLAKKQGCTVIVSSSDATDHNKKYLEKGADFVINGEAEITLQELITSLEEKSDYYELPGISFIKDEVLIKTRQRSVLRSLDDLPLPAWDLINVEEYKKVWKHGGQRFTLNIATTRGCPYKCNWCAKPIYGNRYNAHSPEYIVEEIKHLKDNFGVDRFWMCDDIFGLKPGWVQQFNHLLKKQGLEISYYIQSRADLLLREDTIDALADSGLEEVWIGAESGSQKILEAMDKGTTVEQIYEATKLIKAKGIKIAFFIQFGYLGETKEDINKTIDMIRELVPDSLGISVSYPLPGTLFYDKVKDDLQLKANWTDSDDLAMMFKGSFNSTYYKKLHRYVHKEHRKFLAMNNLKTFLKKPSNLLSYRKLRSVALYFYYALFSKVYEVQLQKISNVRN